MQTRIQSLIQSTKLGEALPDAEYGSCFGRAIAAPPGRVWEALFDLRVSDLTVSKPLILARYPWRRLSKYPRLTDPGGVADPIHADPPRSACSGFVSRVWEPTQQRGPQFAGLDELRAFSEPGWLKLGMDMQLTELPGHRTYLQVATLCEPTDDVARARFRPYWAFIQPFSALIRLDLLAAVARRAAAARPVSLVGQPAAEA